MIRFELLFGLVDLALFLFCLIDLIQTPEDEVRNLPKMTWVLIVLFLPFVGSIAWLVAGRPQRAPRTYPGTASRYDRPGRATPGSPDDDEEFLRQVRARVEEQRRRAAEQKAQSEPTGETAPENPTET